MDRDKASAWTLDWWRNLSVRARLLGLCAGLVIAFGSGNLLLTYLFELNHRDQVATQEQYRRFAIFASARQAMSLYRHLGGQVNSAVLAKDKDKEREARRVLEIARESLDQKLDELGQFDGTSQKTVQTALDEVPHYSELVIDAIARGQQESAKPIIAELQRRLTLIEETLESARLREFALAQDIQTNGQDRAQFARRAGAVINLSILVIGVLLIVTVTRSILRPLRTTTEAIRQVNAGELPIKLPPMRRDEFGDMAKAIGHFRDHAEKLRRLAYHDALTGLGNRSSLEEFLERKLAGRTHGAAVALFYLDMDNLRSVNQRLGYHLGDRYLCEAVERLQRFIPTGSDLFRYSGDKFVAVIDVVASELGIESDLRNAAAMVLRGVSEPYAIPNDVLNMSTSIGIAVCPDDGETAEQLMSSAEAAAFAAKKRGRNNARFAGEKLAGELRKQKALANEIRAALARGEFDVYYQPIVDFASQRVIGAEALARWLHPQRGVLNADQFIRVAEEEGLIGALGLRSMEIAHRQAEIWLAEGHDWRIAVNLSARQLDSGDILEVLGRLRPGGDPRTNQVDLELTESVLFDTSDAARNLLNAIRRLGYRIGMDDFGTGYSSFNYLQWLPIDKIKIDRQFVSTMEVSRQAKGIISATIALAENLELDVVAEGVETDQQARLLVKLGCRLQQGFHFSPALPATAFEDWAAAFAARAALADKA